MTSPVRPLPVCLASSSPFPAVSLLPLSCVVLSPCELSARGCCTQRAGTFARIGFMRTQGVVEECLLARMSTYKIADRRRLFQIFQALKEGNFLSGHNMTSWAEHGQHRAACARMPPAVRRTTWASQLPINNI
jgi:hypothetical protein